MDTLSRGNYLGTQLDSYVYKKITVSKAAYCSPANKEWHCHENPFFAYFLKGGNYEYRGSKEIKCSAGTLLYYPSQVPHCNKAYTSNCKIFHVEVENNWLHDFGFAETKLRADVINDLIIKNTFTNILNEFDIRDELSGSSIETLLVYLFNLLNRSSLQQSSIPAWTKKFNSLIKDSIQQELTLDSVSKQLQMHPVTLSKEFTRHYGCGFGDYIRQHKIEGSLPLLTRKSLSLDEVAFLSGFSDTSNFIRSFKKVKGITPGAYRQMI